MMTGEYQEISLPVKTLIKPCKGLKHFSKGLAWVVHILCENANKTLQGIKTT